MKIVIITAEEGNFVPVELAKHAKELGHEVEIANILNAILVEQSFSRNETANVLFKLTKGEDETKENKLEPISLPFVCIPRLNEHDLDYKLNVFERLETLGAIMLNSAKSMELCNNKLHAQVVLNNAGIHTPWSMAIGSLDIMDDALNYAEEQGHLKFPIILKTLRGAHGIGVMKIDSRASLVSVIQVLVSQGKQVMVQEFISHEKSARIVMLGNEMLAANIRTMQPKAKEKGEFRTNSHLGAKTSKHDPSEEEMAIARKITESFGCRFCAIDYIITDDGIIVLEVNGSPGLEAIQQDWLGERDLAKMVVEYCASLVQDDNSIGKANTTNVNSFIKMDDLLAASTRAQEDPVNATLLAKAKEDSATNPLRPLSDIEPIQVMRLMDTCVRGRVDTGATFCSLHADKVEDLEDWIKFTRGDITYKVPVDRHMKIKNAHGATHRAIIKLDVTVRDKRYNQIEFTIIDRSGMNYEVLIGRNLLKEIGLPVMIYKEDGTQVVADVQSESDIEEV
jgi:ribosomal protein S6--L-glutamate ligase